MKRLLRFAGTYILFTLTVSLAIAGLALQVLKLHTASHWLLGVTAIIACLPLLRDMWHSLRAGSYGIDVLAITAIVTSVTLGQYWAGIVIVLMLTGGESLEDYAEHRAKSELDALLSQAPQTAQVIRKGKTLTVKVDDIHVGEKVFIKAGELVPVDATVLEGTASFDEASLTGESQPQMKQVGDMLLSGSINLDGPVTVKTTALAEDSQYQQIIRLVRAASANQAPFVRLADRYSLPFTFIALAIASAMWALSGHAVRFLEVLVVATPCPLILAAPIAIISGMARASRYGIIVKTGSALERLAAAKTIAFDKTGTLTRGELSVTAVTSYGELTKDQVLGLAASLEQGSNHVVAQALVSAAHTQKIKLTKAKHVKEIAGRGLQAQLKGQQLLVGRLSLLEEHEVALPAKFKKDSVTQTAVYLAVAGELAGVISFSDEPRAEAAATLQRLQALGLQQTIMVTGDNQATADIVAQQLGIGQVYAETLPADKLNIVEKITQRPVAFVGDGINDAPVLTAADVGIALGARGSTAASESADVVIMVDDLSRVADGLEIAKRSFGIARQSIRVGIGLSFLLMLVFATGKFSPLAGALIQEVVDVIVIFNALRAHLITPSSQQS
jgi:heavy metal translocating P-type ATPase